MKEAPRTDWNEYARDYDRERILGRNRLLAEHHQGVLRDFLAFFSTVPIDARILDIGCASGFFLVLLRELGFENIEGIDASEVFVKRARRKGLDCRVMDIVGPAAAGWGERYDIVLLMDVLEHLHDPGMVIERARDLFLCEDGRLFITVPIYDSIVGKACALMRGKSRIERAREHDATHVHGFSEKELFALIEKAGCRVTDSKRFYCPLPFVPSRRLRLAFDLLLPGRLKGMFVRVVARPASAGS